MPEKSSEWDSEAVVSAIEKLDIRGLAKLQDAVVLRMVRIRTPHTVCVLGHVQANVGPTLCSLCCVGEPQPAAAVLGYEGMQWNINGTPNKPAFEF